AKMKYSEVFCALHNIDPSYRKEVEDYTTYSQYGAVITWPRFYLQNNQLSEFEEEDDWKNYLESLFAKIEWDRPALCGNPSYVSFAEYAMNEEAKANGKSGSFILDAFDVVKSKTDNQQVKDFFMLNYLKKYMKDEPVS